MPADGAIPAGDATPKDDAPARCPEAWSGGSLVRGSGLSVTIELGTPQ